MHQVQIDYLGKWRHIRAKDVQSTRRSFYGWYESQNLLQFTEISLINEVLAQDSPTT